MRKIYLLMFVMILTISLFISCGKKEEKLTGSEKVNLVYKFEKGDKFRYKLTSIITTEESVKADSMMSAKSNQNDVYVIDFEVLDVDVDTVAELNATITSINVNIDANGQKLNFDPGKAPNKEEQQKFWQYAIQYNSTFRARVNKYGEVIEVSRLEKMIDKMNSLQPQPQTISPAEKAKLSRDLADGIIRPFTQLIFRELPRKSISKDSTWEKKYSSQITVFKTNNTAQFKVDDFVLTGEDNAAKVSVTLSASSEGEKNAEQNGVKYYFEDPKISGTGSILFNIDKGLLAKSETLTTVELVANIEGKNALQKTVRTIRRDISTNKNIIELL